MELTAIIGHDELVERCKRGDSRSYEALYLKYCKAMYNTSLRILNSVPDAEDVLQEAFLDAFRSLNEFHYRSTFGAWLKRIVINKSINLLRKRKLTLMEMDENGIEIFDDDGSHDRYETDMKVEEVKGAIRRLPDGYRTVISLYLLEGYDQEEIADIMGISHVTVRTQYIRAKHKLLSILKAGAS